MTDWKKSDRNPTSSNPMSLALSLKELENAARGSLVKISPSKLRLIRVFEAIAFPLVWTFERLRPERADTQPEPRRILVVEYWNLGDIVMILPFLQNLRVHYPNAHITLMTNPRLQPLLEGQGLVNQVITVRVPWAQHFNRWKKYNPFATAWLELIRGLLKLRKQQFDLAFSGRIDVRDNFILWLSGAQRRVGYAVAGGRFFLTDVATPDPRYPHRSDLWLGLFGNLRTPPLNHPPRLKPGLREQEFAENYLLEHGIRRGDFIVGIHAGARISTRQWGFQNFRAVAHRLTDQFPLKILWFDDPREANSERMESSTNLIPVFLPLPQFMAVLARCQLLVCNDSGPMHISTALGVPVVAVFGPTEPSWCEPLGTGNRVVIRNGFLCRPCFDRCIFDQPYCLRTISIEEVFAAADEIVQRLISNFAADSKGSDRVQVHGLSAV
jgi:ADP-heptose:LPS heptosyltransferase